MIALLTNALKFQDPQGKITITVDLKSSEKTQITIEDEGVGIKKENIENILTSYDNLYLKHRGITSRGIGLGLNFCQKIAQKLGSTGLIFDFERKTGTSISFEIKHPSEDDSPDLTENSNIQTHEDEILEPDEQTIKQNTQYSRYSQK